MVVCGVVVDSARQLEDAHLLAPLNIFPQGCSYGFALGFVFANRTRFFDQCIVKCKVGGHVSIVTHSNVWINGGFPPSQGVKRIKIGAEEGTSHPYALRFPIVSGKIPPLQ